MNADISKLTNKEIEEEISCLENAYAECFGEEQGSQILRVIRAKILALQSELSNRTPSQTKDTTDSNKSASV